MSIADARIPMTTGVTQLAAWAAGAVPPSLHWSGRLAQIVVTCLAALLAGTASVRVGGRHLFGWVFTWIPYRLRQHSDRRAARDPLHALAHDFRLRQDLDRAGNQFGVVGVGDGWSAVVRVDGEPPIGTLLAALSRAFTDDEIPLAGAQLLIRDRCRKRAHLIAVRYRPDQAPLAALLWGGGEAGALRATTRAAQALIGTLAESGQHGHLLDVGELAVELRTTLGGDTWGPPVTDGWGWWTAGGTTHASFAPPRNTDPEAVLAAQSATASFTVVSHTLWRTDAGNRRDETTLRLVEDQTARLAPRARDVDVSVFPLYGRQSSGVRRTLPLALPR